MITYLFKSRIGNLFEKDGIDRIKVPSSNHSSIGIIIDMKIILDTQNVFEYLTAHNYCQLAERDSSEVKLIPAKNFNLLISFADGKNLLVKQELSNDRGETKGEFFTAWRMQELVKHFPNFVEEIGDFLPELLHFDRDNSILIVKYLADYQDLSNYYTKEGQFPIAIARSIGQLLATIHSQTFQQVEYYNFLTNAPISVAASASAILQRRGSANDIIQRLTWITPDIFQMMPLECLQFFKLYQRFPSLAQAIDDLGRSISPCCLVHNDLKINNILLDLQWEQPTSKLIKLIDWERASWGDPAFDLGCILGSYLEIWLDGLIVSNSLSINDSLQLATTPLELLQPSLFNLVQAYLESFPSIIAVRPDYLDRSIQFAGLALIQRVETTIDEYRVFGNRGIVMLQVAKQLICTPQAAMNTLFGSNSDRLNQLRIEN
jgi:serine/threonine protein kinase